jgi:hypothetical protein
MINKFYKRIHNKYSTLFKFIFFLRYLFGIFFISVVLFLFIPHLFDFKKKDTVIKNYLLKKYDIKLNKYESIKYNSLPTPYIEIKIADVGVAMDSLQMKVGSLNIYPKLLSIYHYKNFETNKIVLKKNKILLEDTDLKILINYIHNLKNKLSFKNLDLKIKRQDTALIDINKIYFSNYGYDKNIFRGEIFDKNFKISTSDNYKRINFNLLKTGITIDVNFDENKKKNMISGILRSKLLNSNIKFNFDYDDKKLKIYNSFFRSKNLTFNNESVLTYLPFFNLTSTFDIEDVNIKFLKKLNINKILDSKKLIKRINTKNKINFKSKKFSQNLIDNLNLNVDLAYGRLVYLKKITISGNFSMCQGYIDLLKDYPIMYFDCEIMAVDKKNLLKEFSIKYKNKNEPFKLNAKGNINILNNKVNFTNISMNQDYEASKEDLNYFKESFETILFNKDFFDIFNFSKIKKFILEIS